MNGKLPAIVPTPMRNRKALSQQASAVNAILKDCYPDAHCALNFRNPFELLVATILSAQCTDARVNLVTPQLFQRCPDPQAMATIPLAELEELIRSTGFYRNKARNLQGMAQALLERFGGEVPNRMEDLTTVPGAGRKTANVVLGNCFGIPGITVDTHMSRLTRRIGLTRNTDPVKIEADLMQLLPPEEWTLFSHRIISHGRQVCDARKPLCQQCPISAHCKHYTTGIAGENRPATAKRRSKPS